MLKIFIVAGEVSGAKIAQDSIFNILLRFGLGYNEYFVDKSRHTKTIDIRGVFDLGEYGMFSVRKLSAIGFGFGLLFSLYGIYLHYKKLIKAIEDFQPDILITVDSQGLSKQIAQYFVNNKNIHKIHIVAPTVWIYNKNRIEKYAKLFDKMLVLFEFEMEYWKDMIDTYHIGHNYILESKTEKYISSIEGANENNKIKKIILYPGSRKSEIMQMLPIFLKSVKYMIKNDFKDFKYIILVSSFDQFQNFTNLQIDKYLKKYIDSEKIVEHKIVPDGTIYQNVDLAITKIGTIVQELAYHKIYMVVAHKIDKITEYCLKHLFKRESSYILVPNFIENEMLIPELLYRDSNPKTIALIASNILNLQDMHHKYNHYQENFAQAQEAIRNNILPRNNDADLWKEILTDFLPYVEKN